MSERLRCCLMTADDLRRSPTGDRIRAERLIVVLRRVEPIERLAAIAAELAASGALIFEVTMDAADPAAALAACRAALPADALLGAGTVRSAADLRTAVEAGVDFAVSPILDADLLQAAVAADVPFIPGAYSPTEIAKAWDAGATFVKLFPASSLGPSFLRELRGPLAEVPLIPTGGIDGTNVAAFLGAGAVAVGIGSAIVAADSAGRRAILDAVRSAS